MLLRGIVSTGVARGEGGVIGWRRFTIKDLHLQLRLKRIVKVVADGKLRIQQHPPMRTYPARDAVPPIRGAARERHELSRYGVR